MRIFKKFIIGMISILFWTGAANAEGFSLDSLNVISYHEIVEDNIKVADMYSISKSEFAKELAWLKENGFNVVTVEQYLQAKNGKSPLPSKPVMLTFDDGYESTYSVAYPLLKEYGYTGVLAIIGSWVDAPKTAAKILTWKQVKELSESGVFEIASHSYDSHHGIQGNPQKNEQPALSTHEYKESHSRYESDIEYVTRVKSDLQKNNQVIKSKVGVSPRIIVWPYGSYTGVAEKIAESLGMSTSIALETPYDRHQGGTLTRLLVSKNLTIPAFAEQLRHEREPDPIRLVHVDLDYVYDANPIQAEKNLSALLDRIKDVGANTVFLQAYCDDKGDSTISSVYFPNSVLPMKADLFNRVAWQIRTRTGASVYAWMPILSYVIPGLPESEYVKATDPSKAHAYKRVSPFSEAGVEKINEIYEGLAKHSHISGIIFHDDGVLTDFEDFSEVAKSEYLKEGLPTNEHSLKKDRKTFERWTALKENKIYALTDRFTATVKNWQHKTLKTARNMYAPVVYNPYAYEWTSQSYRGFSVHYDYVAVMAMPYMEKVTTNHLEWLTNLASNTIPANAIFELQSVDWNTGNSIPASEMSAQIRTLVQAGIKHIGYYPDNFVMGYPDIAGIKKEFSPKSEIDRDIR